MEIGQRVRIKPILLPVFPPRTQEVVGNGRRIGVIIGKNGNFLQVTFRDERNKTEYFFGAACESWLEAVEGDTTS